MADGVSEKTDVTTHKNIVRFYIFPIDMMLRKDHAQPNYCGDL